ncbi:hypothetical protein L2U69_00750 [Zavarzinia compransoris]|uniref:hypothetical protein n=1 Tax=Zavarzinia marina TaxID=2911065 RepID=UPI001F31724A|nr:hypothetical protein [Zavarzinia marina]MCF4164171.1 hypothetical protein [Zavarzinia marina]
MFGITAASPVQNTQASVAVVPVGGQAASSAVQGVPTQTVTAVQAAPAVLFNPHVVYASDIEMVLVQVRDAEGEVTTQYPSEQVVREYRRQQAQARVQTQRLDGEDETVAASTGEATAGGTAADAPAPSGDRETAAVATVTGEAGAAPAPAPFQQVEITV